VNILRFQAVIEINNINPYVLVSAELAAELKQGWRKPLPVCVRVNGKPDTPWRINMMPVGDGSFYLYLHADVRKASNTKVGDAVSLEVQFDEEYRSGPVHPMPPWFSEALDQHPGARQAWNQLTPSLQKEILRYFSRLKSPEAQARNMLQALHVLSGGKGRFLARSWDEGRVQ
jgi:hypothetical protein